MPVNVPGAAIACRRRLPSVRTVASTRDPRPPGPGVSVPLRARTGVAADLGAAVAAVSKLLGGGGSVIGGRAILAVDPQALPRLAAGRVIALVSGTNGKTTTTSLLAAALGSREPVVTNLMGANLPPGLAAAMAAGPPGAAAVLEVDEAWLPKV